MQFTSLHSPTLSMLFFLVRLCYIKSHLERPFVPKLTPPTTAHDFLQGMANSPAQNTPLSSLDQYAKSNHFRDMATLTLTKTVNYLTTPSFYLCHRNGIDEQMILLHGSILLGILVAVCCYLWLWEPNAHLPGHTSYQILLPVLQCIWPAIRYFSLAVGGIYSLGVRALLLLCVDLPDVMDKRVDRYCWRLRGAPERYVPKKLKHVNLADREEVDAYWDMHAPKFNDVFDVDEAETVRPACGGAMGKSDGCDTIYRKQLRLRSAQARVMRHHSRSKSW
ncbi:hypothetical protein SODALDRAFT_12485 [Sodiomyces alkalinus F11]|uniref:Uncharacterized protein n=1 Tax=Sodiomyces alkalinus (strain CBS 110278 / VKM F-3762 / F11) TaxID=1314773 RepID=A0A3N2Q6S0_SODAK|nr:hypothetical protein SODALDRAFT_12485 [Sodiomyces alkalinus F11]ROT42315.1 hypothetical protein SODALDRAFT_12485 [Sodiomyces alkalinus F11]